MNLEHIYLQKKELRKKVASLKRNFTQAQLMQRSESVRDTLEQMDGFKRAKTIFIYHSMPGEVDTRELIKKHRSEKEFLLPVVRKDGLHLKKYVSDDQLITTRYGALEPTGEDFIDYDQIDLIIVPGVAFDKSMNRMGYGKAYYDGILPKIKALKAAVCFDFQLFDSVPHTDSDVKMDLIVCEDKIID